MHIFCVLGAVISNGDTIVRRVDSAGVWGAVLD